MGQILLVLVVALVAAAIVFGVVTLIGDSDAGLGPAEPDGRAVPLPGTRPLTEDDLSALSFDTTMRGYRMEQVDQALRRAAYDLGYKDELIGVLEAEVSALRAGDEQAADDLRAARDRARPGHGSDSPDYAITEAEISDADESDTDAVGTPDADATGDDAGESPAAGLTGDVAGDAPVADPTTVDHATADRTP